MQRVYAILFLLCTAVFLSADSLFEMAVSSENISVVATELQQKVAGNEVVRASFVQQKEMVALSKVLETRGTILFSVAQGIVWSVTSPYEMQMVMSNGALYATEDGVETSYDLSSFQSSKMQELLGAIYTGDLSALAKVFALYWSTTNEGWQLGLKPTRGRLKRVLGAITIAGTSDGMVSKVVISSVEAGSTTLLFTPLPQSNAPLTSVERALFEKAH